MSFDPVIADLNAYLDQQGAEMTKECGACEYFEPDDPTKPNGWAALDGICIWDTADAIPLWAEQALDRAHKQISSSDRYCPCWKEAMPSTR